MGLKLQRANINLVENRLILAPEWGSITGDITEQEDLNLILTSVNSELETLDNSLNTTNTNLANLEQTTEGINNRLSGVEQTYATKSELNQLSTDLENLTDSALTEQDADNKYALKNGSISEDFKAKSLYIAPYSISVEGGELSFFHNGGRTNIHLPEDMGSGTVALTKNYYDKTEIDNKLSNLDLSIFEIVNELPTTNINENKIYLVRNEQTTGSNLYTEYRYTNNSWEVLGEYKSDVDLADYYTKTLVDSLLANKANTDDVYNKSDVYNKAEIDDLIASGSSDLFIVDLYNDGWIRSPYTYEEVLEQYNMGKIIVFRYTYIDGTETAISSTYRIGIALWRPQGTPNFSATIPVGKSLYTYTLYKDNDRVSLEQFTPIDNSALTNYYTKTQTYNKTEIDALVSGGSSDLFIVTYTAENNTIDKTIAEINTARDDGKILIIKYVRTVYSDDYLRGVYYGYLQFDLSNYYTGDIRCKLTLYSIHINSAGGVDIQKTELPNYNTTGLTNYYPKTQTYSKSEIDTKIGDIESILATL